MQIHLTSFHPNSKWKKIQNSNSMQTCNEDAIAHER